MADGAKFQATTPDGSTLTTAPPQAFGFLTPTPQAGITVNGSTLAGAKSSTLSLVGGPVTVSGGTLKAPGGKVGILSAASTGEIPVDYRAGPASTVTAYGAVQINNGSTINVEDPTGMLPTGGIHIHGGTLTVADKSSIGADSSGAGPGGKISLRGDAQVNLTNGANVHSYARSALFRAAKRESLVLAVGTPLCQSAILIRLTATAVITCCRWVLASPIYRHRRNPQRLIACACVPSIPARAA